MQAITKSGFVAVVGRPNAGKSTLLNWIIGERLAMVSHKANATRKRLKVFALHKEGQIIFVDTPGIHEKERLLNQFMLQEALKAIGDCDFLFFLAPVSDSLEHYEKFLELAKGRPHALLLSKIDMVSKEKLLAKIAEYSQYDSIYSALIPVSVKKETAKEAILNEALKHLPDSPPLYDPEDLTNEDMRSLYREMIRESIFENVSDEIPYESDVVIEKVEELPGLDRVSAQIIVEKESQKMVMIGKDGATLKRIGKAARIEMEKLSGKKVYLALFVKLVRGWSKDKKGLKSVGYDFEH